MNATDTAEPAAEDIRPLVASVQNRRGLFLFAAILAALGGGLFATLEMRRSQISSPRLAAPIDGQQGMIASPPELVIPLDYPGYGDLYDARGFPAAASSLANRGNAPAAAPARTEREAQPAAAAQPGYAPAPYPVPQQGPPLPDFPYPAPPGQSTTNVTRDDPNDPAGRTQASFLRNPATTVPQGTVIQAVLETALDSTRPGFARALVTRDVSGFDGSRVLIPRGSRLFGEYASDLSLGEKRAHIQWRRLTRPDGAIIDLKSPSADPLGRAGIKGQVNSHFFQRFSGAILQSVLDIGVGVATREAAGNNPVVLALPNSVQSIQVQKPEDIKPTLKVRHGKSVSVMVSRDLDFTDVEK